jgi:RNA polymerase sigma factor (sigma-70 family)
MTDRTTDNESALVCAARRGDKEALATLLRRNWAWVRGLVYSVLADRQGLDDVLQDICLRVVTKIHTLREPARFRAWLAIVARREALNHGRRRAYERARLDVGSMPMPAFADTRDPFSRVQDRELCGHVLEAVSRLPQKYREVFVLAHTGEMTYAQIAEILDVPITTMQIRLVRARRMVRNEVMGTNRCQVNNR